MLAEQTQFTQSRLEILEQKRWDAVVDEMAALAGAAPATVQASAPSDEEEALDLLLAQVLVCCELGKHRGQRNAWIRWHRIRLSAGHCPCTLV